VPGEGRWVLKRSIGDLLEDLGRHRIDYKHARRLATLIALAEAGSDDQVETFDDLESLHGVAEKPDLFGVVKATAKGRPVQLAHAESLIADFVVFVANDQG